MQPSTLLTIAAFPALFAAVMAAGACQAVAGTDIQCSSVTAAGLTALATCKTLDPDCMGIFIAAIQNASPAPTPDDQANIAKFFSVSSDVAMTKPKLFSYFKTKVATFKTSAAAGSVAVPVDIFSGLDAKEFQAVDKSVIQAISPATFATLTPADFKNMNKTVADFITEAQWPKLTKEQADAFGSEKPGDDVKDAALTTLQDASACRCKAIKDDKSKLITDDKVKKALKERCSWANSASAVSVTVFLTVASLASVFLMNTLAF